MKTNHRRGTKDTRDHKQATVVQHAKMIAYPYKGPQWGCNSGAKSMRHQTAGAKKGRRKALKREGEKELRRQLKELD
jgi:hypothetical protein